MDVDSIARLSLACPAMPLCGLAIGEAERAMPDIVVRLRALMTSLGFDESEGPVVRITGCPNGCSRPYMAEIALVGDGPNSYQLWLGGDPAQTRLAEPFLDRMKIQVGGHAPRFAVQGQHASGNMHDALSLLAATGQPTPCHSPDIPAKRGTVTRSRYARFAGMHVKIITGISTQASASTHLLIT